MLSSLRASAPPRETPLGHLGFGVGLRSVHFSHILRHWPAVDWFEIISENYRVEGGRALHVLDRILERYRVVQHGVSMYFGNAARPNRDHLRKLKALTRRTATVTSSVPDAASASRSTWRLG